MSFEVLAHLFKTLELKSSEHLPEGFIEVHQSDELGEVTISIGDSSFTFNEDLECVDVGAMLGMFKKWSVIRLEERELPALTESEEEEFVTEADTNVESAQDQEWWQKGDKKPDWSKDDEHDDEEEDFV